MLVERLMVRSKSPGMCWGCAAIGPGDILIGSWNLRSDRDSLSPKPIFHKIDLQYLEAFREPKHTLPLTDVRARGCQACDTGLLLVRWSPPGPLIGWWSLVTLMGGINIIIGGHPCQGVGLSAPTLEREHSDQSEGVCGLTDQWEARSVHLMKGRGRLW